MAVSTILPEKHSDRAARLKDEYVRGLHEFISPDVFAVECAHAITRAERKRYITALEATQGVADLLLVFPFLRPSLTLLPRAVEISLQARIGVYDCLYLALGEKEGIPVITADGPMRGVKGFQTIDIEAI